MIDPGLGPVITSAIRVPDALDGGDGRGFYLEDAGYPAFASWMLEVLEEPEALVRAAPKAAHYAALAAPRPAGERDRRCGLRACWALRLLLGPAAAAGHGPRHPGRDDDASRASGSSATGPSTAPPPPYFDRVRALSRQVAEAFGAEFLDNPIWHENRVVTVHSLGGCRMGRSDREGVVDPYGSVFGYPGLHIADGSVMPGPVGANPSLTIAALADRFADAILEQPRSPRGQRFAPASAGSAGTVDSAPGERGRAGGRWGSRSPRR